MIILILRNQFEYITSYYRERVAGGAYISFPNFMKYCLSNYNASFYSNLNYLIYAIIIPKSLVKIMSKYFCMKNFLMKKKF